MHPTIIPSLSIAFLAISATCSEIPKRELTLDSKEQQQVASASSRLRNDYLRTPGIQEFASAWLDIEDHFFATQTIVPGANPTDTATSNNIPQTKVNKFAEAYSERIMQFVATQTYVTGAAKETLTHDMKDYVQYADETGGAAGSGVGAAVGMAVGVVAGVVALVLVF
ncbi:hypothetical protein BDD12DRAFT_914610 [Trichophaea hybrida]|nr:hypothetical protein BDD12DRAFT_914610 [Trichophaea hybrida]